METRDATELGFTGWEVVSEVEEALAWKQGMQLVDSVKLVFFRRVEEALAWKQGMQQDSPPVPQIAPPR